MAQCAALATSTSQGTQLEGWPVVGKQGTVSQPLLAPCSTGHGDPTEVYPDLSRRRGREGRGAENPEERTALTGTEDPERPEVRDTRQLSRATPACSSA